MKQRNSKEWIFELEKVGVPCGPINNLKQVFEHPQVKARGTQIELSHPLAGMVPQEANPIKFIGEKLEYKGGPPTLGQHTEEILKEVLKLGKKEILSLRNSGVVDTA